MKNNSLPAVVKIGEGTERYFSPEVKEKTGGDINAALDLMEGVGGYNVSFWQGLVFLPENYEKKTLSVIANCREEVFSI